MADRTLPAGDTKSPMLDGVDASQCGELERERRICVVYYLLCSTTERTDATCQGGADGKRKYAQKL